MLPLYSLFIAVVPPEPINFENSPIIVIGQRLQTAEKALKDCLDRRCNADQDADASLALAEAQLLAGDYALARATLQQAIKRNKDFAAQYPVAVSDLYKANGKVAAHLGIDSDYYRSSYRALDALAAGLPRDDIRLFMARVDIAEMLGKTRNHDWARNYYDAIARDARKAGREDIALLVELRALIRHYPEGEPRTKAIEKIANSRLPEGKAAQLEARLALARAAYEVGDTAVANTIQAAMSMDPPKKPILIWAPPIQLAQRELENGSFFDVQMFSSEGGGGGISRTKSLPSLARWSTTSRLSEPVEGMWADIRFKIDADGSVSDVHVVRSRGGTHWTTPLLQSIRGRRYTAPPGSEAIVRNERYTYTAAIQPQSGSRLADRSPQARIEYFDLDPEGITQSN